MELFLVRHGETVDNVAGLYAGVRDSALTNHGVQQARRLGEHFAKNGISFTHIYASPLTRALKTAQAIRSGQPDVQQIDIVQVADLVEQDFGYLEGKPFHARSDSKKSGRETHRENQRDDSGFVDVETKRSMNTRADRFLDDHLMPLFNGVDKQVVVVVSHGMLLSHLWRSFLQRLPAKSITVDPEVTATRGSVVLQHLGGWGNTGYLQLILTRNAKAEAASVDEERVVDKNDSESQSSATPALLTGWSTLIRAIDSKDHLVGLKRQRGGIGRSAYDEGQKKLDGFFFKRQRTS